MKITNKQLRNMIIAEMKQMDVTVGTGPGAVPTNEPITGLEWVDAYVDNIKRIIKLARDEGAVPSKHAQGALQQLDILSNNVKDNLK